MTHDLDKVGTIFSSRWENVVIATSPNLTVSPTFKGGQINNVPGIHVLYLQCTAVASKPRKQADTAGTREIFRVLPYLSPGIVRNRTSVFWESCCGLTTIVMLVFVASLTLG